MKSPAIRALLNKIIETATAASLWHILWVSVFSSVVLSLLITSVMSKLFHGRVTADYLVTGTVAALLVSSAVVALIVLFVERIRNQDHLHEEERRRSALLNARLAEAVEQAADGVFITDAARRIIFANPAFCRLTGYDAAELLVTSPALLDSGMRPAAVEAAPWHAAEGGKTWAGKIVSRRKDGTLLDLFITLSPVFNERGETAHFVAVARDVSREEMFNRARTYFTEITAHELRTPLSGLMVAQMLLENVQTVPAAASAALNEAAAALAKVREDFEGILATTSMLAQLGYPEMGRQESPCNLHAILTQCAIATRHNFSREGRQVSLTADLSRLPELTEILANHRMLAWAVNELLMNAVRFTPDGAGVTLAARVEEAMAVVEISDEGIGVPPGGERYLYEPYFALEDVLQHSSGKYRFKSGGMGVGLAIVKLIADYHNARLIHVSGGAGKGTIARLGFPLLTNTGG